MIDIRWFDIKHVKYVQVIVIVRLTEITNEKKIIIDRYLFETYHLKKFKLS